MSVDRNLKIMIIALMTVLGLIWGLPAAEAQESECIKCHTNAEKLKKFAKMRVRPDGLRNMKGALVQSMPRYKSVLIDPALFKDENHGYLGCEVCHGGNPNSSDFKKAHFGIKLDPSYPAPGRCQQCHKEMKYYATSLHYNINGLRTPIDIRSNPDPAVRAKINQAMVACSRCHSSCGECHVGRPAQAGRGLLAGHLFKKQPPMEVTCAACHNSTVSEYIGRHESLKPDIHYDNDMNCMDCHTKEQMHGDGKIYKSRYDVEGAPNCLECHDDLYEGTGKTQQTHKTHKSKITCQVCHSQAYTNCTSCHLKMDWGEGKYKSYLAFKIGLNTNKSEKRPEKFVTVRQVPVYHDMFKPFVDNALTNFDKLPTWKMATPHNIRLKTPQNADCNSCHGNWKLFLRRGEGGNEFIKANKPVRVPPRMIPAKIKDEK